MTVKLPTGVLVAFEGIDGAGKTTQARRLGGLLHAAGFDVVQTKEPTNGRWGRVLRESAQHGRLPPEEELATFLKDRRVHVRHLIRPALVAGKVVIVDRYYFSSVAYQGSRGLDPSMIVALNEEFAPHPDLLIMLQVPPAIGLDRIRARGDVANLFEREEELAKAASIFRDTERPFILRIDGTLPIDEIGDHVVQALLDGPLLDRLCAKKADHCAPGFCAFIADCAHAHLALHPAADPAPAAAVAAIAANTSLTPEEQLRRTMAVFGLDEP